MRLGLALIVTLCLTPALALAELDDAGNLTYDPGQNPGEPGDAPGDPCGQCPTPGTGQRGVTFKGGDLWTIDGAGLLSHYVNCTIVEQQGTQTGASTFGLGYDSMRNLWVITSPSTDRVYQVDMGGGVVNSWPTPGSGPVGAAYDPSRDLYWITDFNTGQVYSVNPNTGLPGPAINVPAGSRLAGTGYNAGGDILFYSGRNEAMSYCISASTGQLLFSFPVPGGGNNNGQGAGCAPGTGNGWLTNFDQPFVYCTESCGGATPVEASTWGTIKSLYD